MQGVSKSISGFDPRSIVGCSLWLDASDSTTLTLSSGNMTQWNDKSGNANTMTQYGGYSNVTVSSAYQNGLNVLNFSGGGIYRTPASSAIYPQDVYIIVALKDLTTTVDVLGMGATSTDNFNSLTFGEYTTGRWHNGSSFFNRTPNCVSPTNETLTSFVLIQWSIADSNYLLRRNGTQLVQTASYTFTLTSGSVFQLGLRYPNYTSGAPSNPFRGYIGEILAFNTQLGTTQRQSVEGYLAWKWGLQVQTPVAPVLSPLSISGCALWLDAADTSTITSSSGSVSQWVDKASRLALLQTTASNQPTTTTLAALNNLPVMAFSNATATRSITSSATTTSTGAHTMFMVLYLTSGANVMTKYGIYPADLKYIYTGNGTLYSANFAGSAGISRSVQQGALGSVIFASNTPYLMMFSDRDATTSITDFTFRINGTTSSTLNFYSSDSNVTPSLTAVFGVTGYGSATSYVGEVLYYNRVLASNEYQSVENYLMGKWGIKPSLPATHPFYSIPSFSRPFQPIDVPGCALWLDGADLSTITGSSPVTAWRDKANSYSFAGTGAVNSTSSLLGRNCLQFNYASYLTFNNGTTQIITQPYTVFAVANAGAAPATWMRVFNGLSNTTYDLLVFLGTSNGYAVLNSGNGVTNAWNNNNPIISPNVLALNTWTMTAGVVSNTNIQPYVNGTVSTLQSGTLTAGSLTGLNIGGGYGTLTNANAQGWNGLIGEVIVYNGVLTNPQRQQVEGYLAAKWGLLNNLPGATFSPLTVSGCALWLDAADTSTLTLSTNNVTQWRDKSGSGNNATQATSSSQPTSGGSQNGLNTLLFTGKTMVLPTISLSTQTVFCVYLNTTFTPYGEPVELGPFAFFYAAPSSNVGIGRTGATDEVLANWSTNGLTTSKYTVYGGTVSVSGSTTSVLYFNGNQVASNTVTSSGGQVYYRVGHYAGGTTGYIAEVIVFNSVLSTTQRRSVENYLMGKWGISNVTTHPFKNIPPSTSAPPQFQEVTPGNWTYDWQPYLSNLTRANNPANSTVIPTLAYGTGGPSLSPALSTQRYGGGVLAPNGTIYCVSSSTTSNILMINTVTNGVSYGTGGPSLSPALSTQTYSGGVLTPNGTIYCIPFSASNILMINTATNGVSYGTGGPSLSPALSTQQYQGGVLTPNGTIYGIPFSASNILMINTVTNGVSYGTGGPSLSPALSTQRYRGGILAPNGTIYCIPDGSSNILMINTATNGVSYGTGGPSLSPALSAQNYRGGVLGPNGTIYYIPNGSSNILMINTVTNGVSYGTGGPSLSPALSTQNYFGGVLAPNGNIYCIPNGASNILMINTVTNGVSYGTGGPSLSPALSTQQYLGGVLAPNGTIYGIPFSASNILTISNTYTENPSSNYCLSAWTNKL